MENIQYVTLDFVHNNYTSIVMKQYDTNSRFLIINCTDRGIPFLLNPSMHTCKVKMLTPDNRAIYNSVEINDDGSVTVEFTESMLYASGVGKLELNIFESDKLISTMHCHVQIEESVYPDDAIIASDEFSALTEAMLSINDSVTVAQQSIELANETVEKVEILEQNIQVAENNRISNENNREIAEGNRENSTATAISNANIATQNANEATQDALDAISATNTATDNANTATQNANTVIAQMESLIKNDNLIHKSDLGVAGGVASLDENGNIPSSQLPSFVDDVLDGTYDTEKDQFLDLEGNVYTPEPNKIYIDVNNRATYRWSGTTFVTIGTSLTLGTTSSTAYPGDRGLAVEDRVSAIENYHNNIPASDIKFDNARTPILSATVQGALEDLAVTASSTRDGLMSANDKKVFDNYRNIITVEATLLASKWTGSSAPYTQILTVEGLNNYNNCNVVISDTVTVEQENAIMNAEITNITYDEGVGFTFTASGVKPSVDVPILLKFGASMNVVEVPQYLEEVDVASNIFYDNSTSGISATNVKDAIDETNSKLGNTDISHIADGTLTGAVSAVNENLGKYEGAETLGNIDVLSYFENEAPNGISVLQIGGAVNAYSTVQSWFTFYKMPSYGRIEQRPINSDMVFVKYMSAGTWSDWDELATNSDFVVIELPALSMNIQPNTDTHLGNVSIPSGYMVVSTDYIPDHSAGGTGWGSLILHTTSGGTIYGISLATVTNSSGVIRVLCKKI